MRRACIVVTLAMSMVSPAAAHAQVQRPDETLRRFLHALAKRQWDSAASYLDAKVLLAGRDSIISYGSEARVRREVTIDDLLRAYPDMPRVVAEYRLKEIRRHQVENPLPLIWEFPEVRTLEELATFSRRELAIEWLRGHDRRERYRADLRRMGCSESADSLMAELPLRIQVFGWVPAGDSTAFVVFADPLSGDGTEELLNGPLVAHLTKRERVWRITPRYDLFGAANSWSMVAGCPESDGPP